MYESSCSYAGALELKRSALKEEPWPAAEWPPYRLHQSTFEQLKQSVEKAKAALQDRSGLLGTATAFGDFYGGQLGQDGSGTTLGFGRTRNDEMLGSMDKGKNIGTDKISSGLSKGYTTPSLSDTLRATKCSVSIMSNKDYYERWLKIKERLQLALEEDARIQELAVAYVGIKPQANAVEIVARVYCKYCDLYNKLCDVYDQMEQVQRRPYIKKIIDALTCRLLELKWTLEEVEVFEFTYPDNALQQMLMIPSDIQVLCPFFYPFEIREQEMQYIIDQILAGNRLGDPTPSPSELEQKEKERIEQEKLKKDAKDAEIKRKLAMGDEIEESIEEVPLSPQELEQIRKRQEYETHINNIQRMERARVVTREQVHKQNNKLKMYLELSGQKAPQASLELRQKAAKLIQLVIRRYQCLKREHLKDDKLRYKLGMIMSAFHPPSAKIQLEKVKEVRRDFRRKYYEKWMEQNLKEKTRVLKLREGDIMEDISSEIRAWFETFYKEVRTFDEYPWPGEGGTILVVQGDTFSVKEYIQWREAEEVKKKASKGAPKSSEQIKAEKAAAREEQKRLEQEARDKELKRLDDYRKSRLKPESDPGVFISIGTNLKPIQEAVALYNSEWKQIDTLDAPLDAIRGYIMEIVTENTYKEVHLQLRPIVDEMMRLELARLKKALKRDYAAAELELPLVKKRKKPPKVKKPVPETNTVSPEVMFQALADEGIVRKYPRVTLDDYWGDRNYAAADFRAIQWTPVFPLPCIGDVKEQVRTRCLLTMGASCPNAVRAQMFVGPKGAGKKTLIYAIATETNSILIDLSPLHVYNKFPGPKNLKTMYQYVNKISKLMQPTIIFVGDVDKMFYKKVPKEERMFDPKRLQKDFFSQIIKPMQCNDKILVLGTASEPWVAKGPLLYQCFPSLIMIPRTDYGSISYVLTKLLMDYHGVNRDFNVHCVAQALRGFDMNSIRKGIENLLDGNRVAELGHRPLDPMELLSAILNYEGAVYTGEFEQQKFKKWYESYSPWGKKNIDYMLMLESQLMFKMKKEEKKK